MNSYLKLIKRLIRDNSFFVALLAVVYSVAVFVVVTDFNLNTLGEFGYYFAGAAVAAGYAFVSLSYLDRQRKRKRPRVFISYSHEDKEFADTLAADLEEKPITVLIDTKSLIVGDSIADAVSDLVDSCDYFIYISSTKSTDSGWTQAELKKALELDKRILPVVTNNTTLPDLLSGVLYADFSGSYETGLTSLYRAILPR